MLWKGQVFGLSLPPIVRHGFPVIIIIVIIILKY
jgi:hypothetical protein